MEQWQSIHYDSHESDLLTCTKKQLLHLANKDGTPGQWFVDSARTLSVDKTAKYSFVNLPTTVSEAIHYNVLICVSCIILDIVFLFFVTR